MDYLDHNKEIRQRLLLWLGYMLVALAIVVGALILVYQAYGFNLGKNNTVVQNGLVFLSSEPTPANIYINNQLRSEQTDTRLIIPSGVYSLKLTRSGYRNWSRVIEVDGGMVEHYDYPFLFPNQLVASRVASYSSAPGLASQSLDRQWLLVEKPGSLTDFDLYNLKNPAKPTVSTISLPSTIVSKASSSESWQVVAWADDNQHVLLEHLFDNKTEYILLDRANVSQSVNLNSSFNISPTQLTLDNEKYNNYYALDAAGDLRQYSLGSTTGQLIASHVLAYKTYGNNTVLYVTDTGAPKGKVNVQMQSSGTTYTIKVLPISSDYLLDLTSYSSTLYVAAGSNTDNRVYVYQDPVGQLNNYPGKAPVPLWVLHVSQPNYLSFSDSAQFIVAENSTSFAVYDIENNLGYLYTASQTLDAPQTHASWMDGDRLTYVSNGKLVVYDYDHQNIQSLESASPNYLPFFSNDYKYLLNIGVNSSSQYDLSQTPLLTPSDL